MVPAEACPSRCMLKIHRFIQSLTVPRAHRRGCPALLACDVGLLVKQEADGVEADSRIYVGLMHGCTNHGRLEQARELFLAASQLPIKGDAGPLHQHNALIKAECVAGNFAKARPSFLSHIRPAFCKMSAPVCHATESVRQEIDVATQMPEMIVVC